MVRDTVAVETLARFAISRIFMDPESNAVQPSSHRIIVFVLRPLYQCVLHTETQSIPP